MRMLKKNPTRDWFKSMEKISELLFDESLFFPVGRRFRATHNYNHDLLVEIEKDGLRITKVRKK
jgi:hypothetical protein